MSSSQRPACFRLFAEAQREAGGCGWGVVGSGWHSIITELDFAVLRSHSVSVTLVPLREH